MVSEFKNKIEASNLLHKDITLQPDGAFILLFNTANSAGAISVDGYLIHTSGRVIEFYRRYPDEQGTRETVALLTNDMPWIMIAKDRMVNLTTKQLWEKQMSDNKGLKEAAEELKIPVVTAEDLERLSMETKPSVGHYL